MKRILLTIATAFALSLSGIAQTTKVVTDSVTFMPDKVHIFEGLKQNGDTKYWIEIPAEDGTKRVHLSASHVKSGRLLALIEKRDEKTGKYSYYIKFAEPRRRGAGKADLSSLK